MKLKIILISLSLCLLLFAGYWGCVDVSSSGPGIPNPISDFRFIYSDPALPTVTISIAEGPGSTAYSDLSAGTFGTATAYTRYLAGVKNLFLKVSGAPVDPDTAVLSFSADERGTVIVVPRDSVAKIRFIKLSDRYVFAAPGKSDTTLIRFLNVNASRDTVDVVQFKSSSPSRTVVVDNLRFGKVSSFLKVAKDTTVSFYVTKYNSTVASGTDTITVTGASNTQYTVIANDSLSRVGFKLFQDN